MDFDRAKQIVNSKDTYEVLYNGKQIWITGLHPDNATADILEISSNKNINVPVNLLHEGIKLTSEAPIKN